MNNPVYTDNYVIDLANSEAIWACYRMLEDCRETQS